MPRWRCDNCGKEWDAPPEQVRVIQVREAGDLGDALETGIAPEGIDRGLRDVPPWCDCQPLPWRAMSVREVAGEA